MFGFIIMILIFISLFLLPLLAFKNKYRKSAYLMFAGLLIYLYLCTIDNINSFLFAIIAILSVISLYIIGIICWIIGYLLNKK